MRRLRYKQSLVLAAAVLLVAGFASAASAASAKPVKGPCTFCLEATFPAGFVCPFTVSVQDVTNKKFQIVYPDGLIRIAGHRVVRVTNEETGDSRILELNAMFTLGKVLLESYSGSCRDPGRVL